MKTTQTTVDLEALKVFCHMSMEEAGPDIETGKIFGQLHNLAHAAQVRAGLRLDALNEYVSELEIEKTKEVLDGSVTGEILLIATILRVMGESTAEHADELRADEAHLQAKDAENRADDYKAAYVALLRIFG